jgi:hypothetical protein
MYRAGFLIDSINVLHLSGTSCSHANYVVNRECKPHRLWSAFVWGLVDHFPRGSGLWVLDSMLHRTADMTANILQSSQTE